MKENVVTLASYFFLVFRHLCLSGLRPCRTSRSAHNCETMGLFTWREEYPSTRKILEGESS